MPQAEGSCEYVLLQLALPGESVCNVGVLLFHAATGRLHWRLRSDWASLAPPEDAAILSWLDHEFASKAREMGPEQFLLSLENQLSHVLRVTDRRPIDAGDPQAAVSELFGTYCLLGC